ncbi:unnamed protein product [Ostreobium quekettii]|uniref:F-box/LRR-repeat protein 15-like leucin rich repeat domain-containing protein n=1 Tax=Ostreobium quekettii TaxID=121088 RepID=A0A8S1J421_9CHLO|nr:unnamed protein product [Ostreobium quekettii]
MSTMHKQDPEPYVDWGHLPLNILAEVKSALDASQAVSITLTSARLVNRHWNRWATDEVMFMNLSRDSHLNSRMDAIVKRFTRLQALSLRRCTDDMGPGLRALKELRHLWRMEFKYCEMTDAALADVGCLTSLKTLALTGCWGVTCQGLESVARLPSLTHLDLRGSEKVTDRGLRALCRLKSLTSLGLRGCGWSAECGLITDEGLAHVTSLASLARLDLCWCGEITDEGMSQVAELKSLAQLSLHGCRKVTDRGIERVRQSVLPRRLSTGWR